MSNDVQKPDAGVPEQPSSKKALPVRAVTTQRMMAVRSLPVIEPLKRDLRGTKWLGIAIVVMFFGVGGGWAATAPLAGAAVANGVVSPLGSRQTVQHLEGGIIRKILVKEGDKVAAGDALFELEDVRAQSEVGAYMSRLRAYSAQEARLIAERDGTETIDFDHPALADTSDPQVRKIIAQEMNQFSARQASDESRRAILRQRSSQIEKQIDGYDKQLKSVRRQNALIREEIKGVKQLFEKGYERKPRLLALQRREAELLGMEGELQSSVARAQETIAETELQIVDIRVRRSEEVDDALSQVQARRSEVEVLDLRFKTPGGVIRAGEPVLDIVPSEDELIIEVKIRPKDIDDVHAGLSAYVMFPAFARRTTPRIDGTVEQVSADSFEDERTGRRFYKAKVKVNREHLKELAPQIKLQPGMPAEVFIATAERTVLEYLITPFTQMLERSFRES
jgi:multidrug efflux pump subunit AcrA (membrane-fusion protein)